MYTPGSETTTGTTDSSTSEPPPDNEEIPEIDVIPVAVVGGLVAVMGAIIAKKT